MFVPDAFIDPISYEIMSDPVIAEDNRSYSRSTITKWFNQSSDDYSLSPLTGLPIGKTVRENTDLKRAIFQWREFSNVFMSMREHILGSDDTNGVPESTLSLKSETLLSAKKESHNNRMKSIF